MNPANHAAAAAREHQRLLRELYSAPPPAEMLGDLQRAMAAASLHARNTDLQKPGSAAALERLAEHLDGCRRQALKIAQRLRAHQSGAAD